LCVVCCGVVCCGVVVWCVYSRPDTARAKSKKDLKKKKFQRDKTTVVARWSWSVRRWYSVLAVVMVVMVVMVVLVVLVVLVRVGNVMDQREEMGR